MPAIDDLVRMKDAESLNQLLYESEDFMEQLDAAEGLVRLNDKRGYEFLLMASQHEDEEIRQVANEIMETPEVRRYRAQFNEDRKISRLNMIEKAKLRLRQGRKVYIQKMLYVPSEDLLQEDPLGEGYTIPDLELLTLDGWQVINILPRRHKLLVGMADEHIIGAYFCLQKEVDSEADIPE